MYMYFDYLSCQLGIRAASGLKGLAAYENSVDADQTLQSQSDHSLFSALSNIHVVAARSKLGVSEMDRLGSDL